MDQAQAIEVLNQLLDQSAIPIAIADWQGRITVFNAASETLTGYTAAEVIGETAAMFYESPAVAAEIRRRAAEDGKIEDFETVLVGKGARKIPVSLVATVLVNEAGEPIGMMALIKDLSERRGLEDSLRLAKQRADFSNDLMTHDIRNYAQTIGGYIETLLAGHLGAVQPDQARLLKVCRRQAQRIVGLTDNLQLLVRAHEDYQAEDLPVRQSWPLDSAVDDAFRRIRDLYSERHIVLHRAIPGGCAVQACVHFPHVLNNLFANAVGHNPSKSPQIWISAEPITLSGGPGWSIGVADDGPGVGSHCRARLVETNRPFEPGESGVGLWVIRALVQNCGGTLRCEDRLDGSPDEGTRFVTELHATPDSRLAAIPTSEPSP